MGISQDMHGSLLPKVMAASRAMVLLTVEWSGPERRARRAFQSAVEQLEREHPDLGIEFFCLDEDSEWCQAWLEPFGILGLGEGDPRGAGSMLWLAGGRSLSSELGGADLSIDAIVARSLWLWEKDD